MSFYLKKGSTYFNSYYCLLDFNGVFKKNIASSFDTIEKAEEKIKYLKETIEKEYIEHKNLYKTYKNSKEFLDDLEKVKNKWDRLIKKIEIVNYFT